jgi:hypothetical protein
MRTCEVYRLMRRMINSDMRTSHGIRRAYLYENGGRTQGLRIVYDPITYPALKVSYFMITHTGQREQDGCVPVPNTALLNRTLGTGSV